MNSFLWLEKLLKSYSLIAGIDEAGRGPLAGPVVAGVVVIGREELSSLKKLPIKDSKKLTPKKREELFEKIILNFPSGIGTCEVQTIDRINILNATHLAMKRALTDLNTKHPGFEPKFVILDGNMEIKNCSLPQKAIPKADELITLVSAASIIAKVSRDRLIIKLAKKYPAYGFERHKGYGTKEHMNALKKYGPIAIHRKSFRPVRECLMENT